MKGAPATTKARSVSVRRAFFFRVYLPASSSIVDPSRCVPARRKGSVSAWKVFSFRMALELEGCAGSYRRSRRLERLGAHCQRKISPAIGSRAGRRSRAAWAARSPASRSRSGSGSACRCSSPGRRPARAGRLPTRAPGGAPDPTPPRASWLPEKLQQGLATSEGKEKAPAVASRGSSYCFKKPGLMPAAARSSAIRLPLRLLTCFVSEARCRSIAASTFVGRM